MASLVSDKVPHPLIPTQVNVFKLFFSVANVCHFNVRFKHVRIVELDLEVFESSVINVLIRSNTFRFKAVIRLPHSSPFNCYTMLCPGHHQ